MPTKKRKNKGTKKRNITSTLEEVAHIDYKWVVPLAKKVRENSHVISKFISHVFSEIAMAPIVNQKFAVGRFALMKSVTQILFPQAEGILSQAEKSMRILQEGLTEVSSEILKDTDVTQDLLAPLIEIACSSIENNPQLITIFGHPHILEEAFGSIGERLAGLFTIIPALSNHAAEKFPNLKEIFFHALFQLKKSERDQIYKLSEDILGEVYKTKVFPILKKTLSGDPRGKVLAPILLGAIEAIPGESCINAVLSIACTPRSEFSNGRVIAIAIQEIGGLYIKIAQVISELCPPSLARELRTTQDDAGGIFPSIEKSWEYFLNVLADPIYTEWKKYLIIPEKPIRHFASASVGSLYNIELNEAGKEKYGLSSILIKIQRPRLKELFAKQCEHILKLTNEANDALLKDETLTTETGSELLGIISTLKRSVLNYYEQSQGELDFRVEETNANKVRLALGNVSSIRVPNFFFTTENTVFMECVSGIKITKIVQTKYLARREIADKIAQAYIDLVFHKGVVWADPHPGNILYDDLTDQVSMIDLNPCYIWEEKTRQDFKHLIYRLLLRDADGIYQTMYSLVENKEKLHSNFIIDDLSRFLKSTLNGSSLTRFVGEFIKTLSENEIDLKVEVQAALRGLSQIALTTSSISVRNNFGSILRRQFTIKELIGTIWNVGLIRVSKVILSTIFEFTRQMPENDTGPVLDERDLRAIIDRLYELKKENVCHILIHRVSPEDHPNLKMSKDGQSLLITSDLHIEIVDRVRPAVVKYVIEVPQKRWLKDRQEFVKLASIARSFCTIECLEQLRRSSLDEYWRIVESWSKNTDKLTVEEAQLIGEVKVAARKLYSLRFANIWITVFSGLPKRSRYAWKLLIFLETWKENSKQAYVVSKLKKYGDVPFANIAYSGFFRLRIIFYESILWMLRNYLNSFKFSMHLLPMPTKELEDLILFGLSRNYNTKGK